MIIQVDNLNIFIIVMTSLLHNYPYMDAYLKITLDMGWSLYKYF